jgi:Tfp pilus assembly protein PilW
MLIAMVIFGTMLTAAFTVFSSSLQTKRGEDLKLGLQQNVRAAMQIISQDLRSAGVMHIYNQSTCSDSLPCSNNTQVAILALDGTNTAISSTPGSVTSGTSTSVCNAGGFQIGDVAVRYNGTLIGTTVSTNAINYGFANARVLEITGVGPLRSQAVPCAAGTSEDTLTHSNQNISQTIAADGQSFVFKAGLYTYVVKNNANDSNRKSLFRLSGLSTTTSAVVAYDISELKISYGVRLNQDSSNASKIIFYKTLAEAATAATTQSGTRTYTDLPGSTYVGGVITAVRITLTGESASDMPNTHQKYPFTLSETVDLRN